MLHFASIVTFCGVTGCLPSPHCLLVYVCWSLTRKKTMWKKQRQESPAGIPSAAKAQSGGGGSVHGGTELNSSAILIKSKLLCQLTVSVWFDYFSIIILVPCACKLAIALGRGGGGGGLRIWKGWGLFVSLRGVNFGFWSHLGPSGQNAMIFSRECLV